MASIFDQLFCFPFCIFATLCIFYNGLHHCCNCLQAEYHLQCQINLVGCYFSVEYVTYWSCSKQQPLISVPANLTRKWGFRLWYPEHLSISIKLCIHQLRKYESLPWGLLYTGLLNAWLSLTRFRGSLTFPFSFGTGKGLLQHSTVSSRSKGTIISWHWNHSNSTLNSFCGVYMMLLSDVQWGLLPSLTCNENMLLK